MKSIISLYQLEYIFVILGFLVSFLTFYGGLSFIRLFLKKEREQSKWKIGIVSFVLGVFFYSINIMVNLSVLEINDREVLVFHGLIIVLLSSVISYIVIRIILSKNWRGRFLLRGGFLVAGGIFLTFFIGNLVYFNKVIAFNFVQLILALLLIIGFSLCIVRFLHLMNSDENLLISLGWNVLGSLASGTVFLFLPYLVFYGMIEEKLIINLDQQGDPYLIALAFNLLCIGLLIYIPDRYGILKQMEQSEQLVKHEQQFQTLFHHNPDAVFSVDPNGKFISVNFVASEYTGYSISDLKRMSFEDVVAPENANLAKSMFKRSLQGEVHQFEVLIKTKIGDYKELYISTVPIMISGRIVGVYGIAKDVTENNRAEKMIHYLAYHDELTGMANRRYFNEELERLLMHENQVSFAIMLLDFDRFKRINDLFGHEFGDRVIQAIGKRLSEVLDDRFVVARLGGDEFTIIVTGNLGEKGVSLLAQHVLESFQYPLLIDHQECLLTASIGISLYPEHGKDAAELIKYADMAMYDVKDKSTNNYAFYKEEMSNQTLYKIVLENDLRRAIDEDELILHYQPKINTRSNNVIGFEALVRWQHPSIGLISPDEFISAAEETGLIIPIEKWVMSQACQQLKKWQCYFGENLTMAVNLSQRHFYQEDIVCTISSILQTVGLAPSSLELEITESMAMFNEKETIEKLNRLRELGLEISMDDFGTGYSSLSYMNKLPINRLKIDRLFIRDITNNPGDLAIVTTIISMAHNLGLEIIAEGVETEAQLRILHELDCYEVQGYFYSKPLSVEGLEEYMHSYMK